MSFYTIATASLTTPDDRKRRPAVDGGQIARTLVLSVLIAIGLVGAQRVSHAGSPTPPGVEAR